MNKGIFALLWLLFLILHCSTTYFVHYKGKDFYSKQHEKMTGHITLFDSFHQLLPNLSQVEKLEIIFDIVLVLPMIYIFFTNSKASLELLSIALVVFTIRLLFIAATVLPKDQDCKDHSFDLLNFIRGHCYDKVFSGHFSLTLIIAYSLYKYYNIPTIIPIIYTSMSALMILFLRSHYTVDLLVSPAFFVSNL